MPLPCCMTPVTPVTPVTPRPRVTWWLSLGLLCHHVAAYRTGAPGGACSSMSTGHAGPQHQGSSVFKLVLDKSSYIPFEVVEVSILGGVSVPFLGFLLKADNADDMTQSVGRFEPARGGFSGVNWTCGGMAAITHTDDRAKTRLTFTWRAPRSGAARVVFRVTVVTGYYEPSHNDIRSAVLGPTPKGVKTTTMIPWKITATTRINYAASPSMVTTTSSHETTPLVTEGATTTRSTKLTSQYVSTTGEEPAKMSGNGKQQMAYDVFHVVFLLAISFYSVLF